MQNESFGKNGDIGSSSVLRTRSDTLPFFIFKFSVFSLK